MTTDDTLASSPQVRAEMAAVDLQRVASDIIDLMSGPETSEAAAQMAREIVEEAIRIINAAKYAENRRAA
jgi:hypothetical protein